MKKIRKNTQLNFINPKGAGRPAIHDPGIRHTKRLVLKKPSSLHLTIKVRENKADIQNKSILKALHYAIRRARLKRLKVIHYTLEYNHVHLLVEADNNHVLHKGMQSFGITFAKAINKIKRVKGQVYKHRYHLRMISGPKQLKNVLHYILGNGIKHKRTRALLDPYNSLTAEQNLKQVYPDEAKKIWADIHNSDYLKNLQRELMHLLDVRRIFPVLTG